MLLIDNILKKEGRSMNLLWGGSGLGALEARFRNKDKDVGTRFKALKKYYQTLSAKSTEKLRLFLKEN